MSVRPNPAIGIIVGLGAAFTVWAALWLSGARVESNLERGCTELIEGADLEEIVLELGTEAYRPGCDPGSPAAGEAPNPSAGLPCQTATVGSVVDFPYLCEGSDCSMYWRVANVACLVELDPTTLTLRSAAFIPLAAYVDGAAQ